MFEASLLEATCERLGRETRWYFFLTMAGYSFILLTLTTGAIMWVDPVLHEPRGVDTLIAPPPPPGRTSHAPSTKAIRRALITRRFVVPRKALVALPSTAEEWSEGDGPADVDTGVPGGLLLGGETGILRGMFDSGDLTVQLPPSQPRRQPLRPLSEPRRVSSGVLQGTAIRRVEPTYPRVARRARVSGSVKVAVVIDEDGTVIATSAVQGHPFLTRAAVDAARRWRFQPTLLNGVPIKVTGVLIFNFKL